jgi:hypothetical protein
MNYTFDSIVDNEEDLRKGSELSPQLLSDTPSLTINHHQLVVAEVNGVVAKPKHLLVVPKTE